MISDRENAAGGNNLAVALSDPFQPTKPSSISSHQIVLRKSTTRPAPKQNGGRGRRGKARLAPIDWGGLFVTITAFLAMITSHLAAAVNALRQRCARLRGGEADPLPSEVIAKIALYHHDMGGDTMGFVVAVGPRNETLAACLRHSLLKGNVSFLIRHYAFCTSSPAPKEDERAAFNCTLAAWREENDTSNLVAIPPERQEMFLYPYGMQMALLHSRENRKSFLLQLFGNPIAAVKFDNPSLLRSILESGADVNAFHFARIEFSLATASWSRIHILAACIIYDSPNCFKMLLSHEGVNFNSNVEPIPNSGKILSFAICDAMAVLRSRKKNRTEAERLFFLKSLLELPSIDVNASTVNGAFVPPLKKILTSLIFSPTRYPVERCISVSKILIESGASIHIEFVLGGKTTSYLKMLQLLAVDEAFGRELLARHFLEDLPGGVAGLAARCKELLAATCEQDGSAIAM